MSKTLSTYKFIFIAYLCLRSSFGFAQSGLLINEIMANNESAILDIDEESSDWIELHNNTNAEIALLGYTLSDENTSWVFPDLTIEPNSFLIIFASDKDKLDEREPHTNFKLSRDGEEVQLQNANGEVIQSLIYPPLDEDESYGRLVEDKNTWRTFKKPTPGQENILSIEPEDLYTLQSSQLDGFYPNGLKVDISNIQNGDLVYYTLDGSAPTPNSKLYDINSGITIGETVSGDIASISTSEEWETPESGFAKTAILRLAAFRNEVRVSEILSQTFWLSSNPHTLPIVSIIGEEADFFDEDKGIYVKGNNENYFQEGRDWERPVEVSFFDANSELLLSQSAGIRLGGAKTRLEPQKTMRLYARSSYGKSHFEYPFWGEEYGDKFKRITLRTFNVGPWSKAGIMDDLIHQIIDGELNTDYVRRNFAVVYLNGVYWGIHSMREHNNQHFIERKYGVPEDEVVIARATVNESPTVNNFDQLVNDIFLMDLQDSLDYKEVESRLDIEQYTDYIITNLAFSNRDWPHNNVEYWFANNYDGKVRFIINDLDATMLVHNDERLDLFITDQAERLERDRWVRVLIFLQKLLKVPDYRAYFNQRINLLLHSTFAPDRTFAILEEMKRSLENEMESHVDRWHFPNSINQWESAIDRLEEFLLRRPLYLIERSNDLFGFPIEVYPNPVVNTVNLEFDAWQAGHMHIEVFDISGRLLQQSTSEVAEGVQKRELNVGNLIPGIYILRANYQGIQINQRIVKVAE